MKKDYAPSNVNLESSSSKEIFILTLYIIGASPNSARAISNITNICEQRLGQNYDLEIIDVYQEPSKAQDEELIALPMLVKSFPLPLKRLIGDMSDTLRVLKGLGIG